MELFRKVLLPIELSALDTRLMHFVAGLGVYEPAEVMVTHVNRSTGLEAPVAQREERDRGRLTGELASILTDAGVNVTAVPAAGAPVDEILRVAHQEDCTLIVTGTHGKSALNEFVAGSVSETVGRRSKVPVLMVPYRMLAEFADDARAEAAGARLLEHVICPTDFSDVSERTLDLVKALAGGRVGEVIVTHIVDPKDLRAEHQREAALRSDMRILSAIADELTGCGLRAETALEVGPVIAELLELAEKVDASCFMMGSHGRGISEEIFVGSVSQNVIRSAGLPVFINH